MLLLLQLQVQHDSVLRAETTLLSSVMLFGDFSSGYTQTLHQQTHMQWNSPAILANVQEFNLHAYTRNELWTYNKQCIHFCRSISVLIT